MEEAVAGCDSSDLCWLSTWGGELYPGVYWVLTNLPLTLKEAKAASSGVFALETSIVNCMNFIECDWAQSSQEKIGAANLSLWCWFLGAPTLHSVWIKPQNHFCTEASLQLRDICTPGTQFSFSLGCLVFYYGYCRARGAFKHRIWNLDNCV